MNKGAGCSPRGTNERERGGNKGFCFAHLQSKEDASRQPGLATTKSDGSMEIVRWRVLSVTPLLLPVRGGDESS